MMTRIANNGGAMKYSTCLLFTFVLLLTGCLLKYEDVSDEPEHAPLVGTCHALKTNMIVQGINMDPGYGDKIHHYSVKPFNMRGSGPEHITNFTFHAGHEIEVLGVQRSTMPVLFLGKKTRAILRSDFELKPKAPLVVDLRYLLSTNYFEKVENEPSSP